MSPLPIWLIYAIYVVDALGLLYMTGYGLYHLAKGIKSVYRCVREPRI